MTLNTGECCIRCFGACLLPFFRTPIWHDTYGVWTHCWRVKLACQACLCFLNFLMHIPQQNLLELPHLRLCLPHLLMWAQNHSAHATVSEHYLLSLLVHRIPPSPPPLLPSPLHYPQSYSLSICSLLFHFYLLPSTFTAVACIRYTGFRLSKRGMDCIGVRACRE